MRPIKKALIDFSIAHTHFIVFCVTLCTVACAAFFPSMVIDTDPENMLEQTEPARVFHNQSKEDFALSEIIVVGVTDSDNPNGVFTPQTLQHVYALTEYAKSLRWEQSNGEFSGVIEAEIVAPSSVDHMTQDGPGRISFEWLMHKPPQTMAEALAVRDKALSNPILKGQLVSEDGKALGIYLPLTDKLQSYRVYSALSEKIESFGGSAKFHIAGLPVAEGAIGVEMFKQMTLAAPLTMLVMILLLRLFFKKWALVVLPMIVATVSVVCALGLMIGLGYSVHILSSMLPIFLMPIAICDSVHVLSDFFECYTPQKGRKETIREVMSKLYAPIMYTSLTTAAGFLSLVMTTIPPARLFGIFVAFGILVAWATTVFLIPAYVMMLPEKTFVGFGNAARARRTLSAKILRQVGMLTYARSKFVLTGLILVLAVAVWGVSQININDNYAKRFSTSHPIRQADIALNKHFGGLYTAYLIVDGKQDDKITAEDIQTLKLALREFEDQQNHSELQKYTDEVAAILDRASGSNLSVEQVLDQAATRLRVFEPVATDTEFDVLQDLIGFIGLEKERLRLFKRPEVLNYIAGLQAYLQASGIIGKSTSVVDVVKKVNQELMGGDPNDFRIPDRLESIGECLLQYQQSHRPNDLWHMVTPDFKRANIWMQFKTGDSTQTEKAVHAVNAYMAEHKPPVELHVNWSGLHYVNLVFQDKMFDEMLGSFGVSFVIVFCMIAILFRSFVWAIACVVPLSLTIAAIYGMTGLVGKDYDMPVGVVSVVALGIAVDFAIHFMERGRKMVRQTGSWRRALSGVFGEPALAIIRNVLIVAFGFLPLFVADLVPYKTTSIMLFSILTFSGVMTLLCLPALLERFEVVFLDKKSSRRR